MALKQEYKRRIELDDVQWGGWDDDGSRLVTYDNNLFSGYVVYDRFADGSVEAEVEYKNGSNLGWENEYNQSGQLVYSCLTVGQTSLEIYKYNDDGSLSEHWRSVGDNYYEEQVKKYHLLD